MKSDVIRSFQTQASAAALPLLVERANAGQSRLRTRKVRFAADKSARARLSASLPQARWIFMVDWSFKTQDKNPPFYLG